MDCSICFEPLSLRDCKQCNNGVCFNCLFRISYVSDVYVESEPKINCLFFIFNRNKIKKIKQYTLSYSCPICRISDSYKLQSVMQQFLFFLSDLEPPKMFIFYGKKNKEANLLCHFKGFGKKIFLEECLNN